MMLFQKIFSAVSDHYADHRTKYIVTFLTMLLISTPFVVFSDYIGASSEKLSVTLRAVFCVLMGYSCGRIASAINYLTKLRELETSHTEREFQMLNRFRTTIFEITNKHNNTVSELYASIRNSTK